MAITIRLIAAALLVGGAAQARDAASLTLHSSAFSDGGAIPRDFTCDGRGVMPPLSWSAPPAETGSIVVLVEDPDAPGGTFDHLAVYDLPAVQRSLPTAAMQSVGTAGTAVAAARNSGGSSSFAPICPPSGRHRYVFTVMALDVPSLSLTAPTAHDVKRAADGHVLARGKMTGTYARK